MGIMNISRLLSAAVKHTGSGVGLNDVPPMTSWDRGHDPHHPDASHFLIHSTEKITVSASQGCFED